ncbi:MAG: biotin transporter BioY [Erysipelotrichaceae bacterium]|nr:biotin transporter BioY [Erysipelotrichaceae bacterium]MBR3168547.1 biotin transporter BioY [Erysipelotrichaceae bacterium]
MQLTEKTQLTSREKIRAMVMTALGAAIISALAPIAIPLGNFVPISLATLGVMLCGAVLGRKTGTMATLIYLILGMVGMPVFANYSSGAAILIGPTGGYLVGYLPLAYLTGLLAEKENKTMLIAGMVIGTAVLYALGTVWFMHVTTMDLKASLGLCVIPFLFGDTCKMITVFLLRDALRRFSPGRF